MAFSLVFDPTDFGVIQTALTDAALKGADRTDALGYWNGGISGWLTAPLAPPSRASGAVDALQVTCTYKTLADFRSLLSRLATRPGNTYLSGITVDLRGNAAAQEA